MEVVNLNLTTESRHIDGKHLLPTYQYNTERRRNSMKEDSRKTDKSHKHANLKSGESSYLGGRNREGIALESNPSQQD